ncbi:MAG: phosphopyruvate hydratase [Candidatus Pacebacteria bacterium]|nr:phosphopyruvate hydratase [Candidatus Paceibacterota bacterium]
MSTIQQIYAREVLDARGIPTIECSLWLDDGRSVMTTVPSGTSTGKYEAKELRDNDPNRMVGRGVLKAVNNVNFILGPQLIGKDPTNQTDNDQLLVNLDGSRDKSKLGANAIIAVSQTILKAGALSSNLPLYKYIQQKYQLTNTLSIPNCVFNLIEGGKHGAENLDIQEFEIIPASHLNYPDALNMAVTIYTKLREVLIMKGAIHSTGLNGGYTPNLFNNTDAFEIIIETIKATPYTFAQDVFLGADMSASSFYENGKYILKDKSQPYSANELAKYYKSLKELYHVFYIEDAFQEDDVKAWKELTLDIGSTSMIVGDSLLVTSLEKTTKAIQDKLCNSVLVKPNQTGTVSETIQVIKLAKESGWQVIVSHRSGGTIDDFVVDLAVGTGAQYVKFGPPNRGERIAKYNRLSTIYSELQYDAQQVATAQQPEMPAQIQPTDLQTATPIQAELTQSIHINDVPNPLQQQISEITTDPMINSSPDLSQPTTVTTPDPNPIVNLEQSTITPVNVGQTAPNTNQPSVSTQMASVPQQQTTNQTQPIENSNQPVVLNPEGSVNITSPLENN